MARRAFVLAISGVVVALAILFVIGERVLARDRAALFERHASEREEGVEEAARGIASEVGELGEDLELAAALVDGADRMLTEREVRAITSLKRELIVMAVRPDNEATLVVTTLGARPGVAARASATLEAMLDQAQREPGVTQVSTAYQPPGSPEAWYRVYARRRVGEGPTVAVVVDTTVLLARLRLPRDEVTRTLILDPTGEAASASAPRLAELVANKPDFLPGLLASVTFGQRANTRMPAALARSIGMPNTQAIVIGLPLVIDGGRPWCLLFVASTSTIVAQERTIVRRVVVGGGVVVVLLLSGVGYVLYSAFRARTLRQQLLHTERLAHLNEKADKIVENIPSGVMTISDAGIVTGVNRWIEDRGGRSPLGHALADAFPGAPVDDVQAAVRLVESAAAAGEPRSLSLEKTKLFGREAALNLHAVPLARGEPDVSLLLVFDDLTELRRIEQQLLHSEKLVTAGQLAAGIAHEIGTPLNIARGRVELSLGHLGADHAEAQNQRTVIEQIDRVTRLIQQLLDYVRPAPTSRRPLDLAQSLHAVASLLEPQASKRDVTLHIEATPGARLLADPDQIQQIVMNLAMNAIDACDKGGVVHLRARTEGRTSVVEVSDTGGGIPAELQKQVFDPFFTTKKRGQGTGLGLWVVAQLVRAQSGDIAIESAPGAGTTVRVTWPEGT